MLHALHHSTYELNNNGKRPNLIVHLNETSTLECCVIGCKFFSTYDGFFLGVLPTYVKHQIKDRHDTN